MENDAVKIRYSKLADDACCLSCGGALEKSGAVPGEVCIDLGSGRGTDVIRLAGIVGSQGFVYGIDVTPEMVNKGKSAARKLGISNAGFLLAELDKIPLNDELADLIISNCVINHVRNKDRVWAEIYRLLKPNGRFVISDIYSVDPVPQEYSSDPVAVAECWAGAVTKNEYLTGVRQAGFKDVEILEESKPYKKGEIEVCSFTLSGNKRRTDQ
jgi:arsenite methyltransferase